MVVFGVIFGVLCAILMSLSYLLVRQDTAGTGGGITLLVRAQTVEGLVSLVALPWLWPAGLKLDAALLWPAIGAAGFFLIGQASLLTAMRYTEASRISPLLSLKVAGVALITVILLGQPLSVLQWSGVLLAAGAAVMLSHAGGRPPMVAMIAAGITCVCYACSDVCIGQTILAVAPFHLSHLHLGVFVGAFVYTICGFVMLFALPWGGSWRPVDWTWAAPFAITWLAAEACLFICFAFVGIVFGGILQSTRGITSIAIGAAFAAMGFEHLEQRITRGVFWRRMAAAALMTLAIAIFLLGRP